GEPLIQMVVQVIPGEFDLLDRIAFEYLMAVFEPIRGPTVDLCGYAPAVVQSATCHAAPARPLRKIVPRGVTLEDPLKARVPTKPADIERAYLIERDLQADEFRLFGIAIVFEPVRKDQAQSIIVRFLSDRL